MIIVNICLGISLELLWAVWGQSQGSEAPLEEEMAPTPVLLPGKSHGWRSLVDCSPWGH